MLVDDEGLSLSADSTIFNPEEFLDLLSKSLDRFFRISSSSYWLRSTKSAMRDSAWL